MVESANKQFRKLKTFTQFKVMKLGSINRMIDKNTQIFNELFKDLDKMTSTPETTAKLDLYKNREKMNKTEIIIKKEKPKAIKKINKSLKISYFNKPIKYNHVFNMKKSASITTCTNNLNSNKFSFITSPLYTNKSYYYKINPNNMKKSKILINDSNNEKYLFEKKLNHSQKINYETNQTKIIRDNSYSNNKREDSFYKTFISQKSDSQMKRSNLFDRNTLNNRNIKTQQSFNKQLSKKILDDYINESSNILNKQYFKFLEEEEKVNSTIINIKKMIKENEKHESSEKKINDFLKEDIDIPKIRKNMQLFRRSLKGKIAFKTNDLYKSSLITKKIADIINCWESFSRMNDIYFYQHKNAYFKVYPPLSFKATNDPFDKNYAQMFYYIIQKNKMKKNMNKMRKISV